MHKNEVPPRQNKQEFLSGILVLAHRGFREKYPENTFLAFRKALDFGADGIECDVQKTKDGRFVIIHDDNLDRVSTQREYRNKINEMTLDEIKKFDAGMGEHIPELEEFLDSIPVNKFLDIELKKETLSQKDCPEIYEILLKYINKKNLMVSSFEPDLLKYFKARRITTGLLLGADSEKLCFLGLLRIIIKLNPKYLNLPVQVFNELGERKALFLLRIFKLMGKKIAFWTINSEEDLWKVLKFSKIIITDRVEFIIGKLKSK